MSRTPDILPRLTRYLDYFQALAEVGKTLTGNLQQDEVLNAIMRSLTALLKPQNWSLLLLDRPKNELYFEIVVGEASEKLKALRVRVGEGIAGWVALHRKPVVVARVADDPRFANRFDAAAQFNTFSILCVPLICRDQLLGVLELVKDASDPEPFTNEDLEILTPFADFAAIAIDNARTFRRVELLTVIDEWTQLYNARYLEAYLRDEVLRAKRYSHPMAVIFLDLDRFKVVNDTWGHSVGSQLLASVGKLLRECIRETDRPIRYGGDEFVIVMPETDPNGSMAIAQRIRELMPQALPAEYRDQFTLTCSVGVAAFPKDGDEAQSLLDAADRAMYAAKAKGRNNIVLASEMSK